MCPEPPSSGSTDLPDLPAGALDVLVADDDTAIASTIERTLRRRGHAVTTVGNAAAALHRITSGDPDVVVLDLNMPGGGWTVLQSLLERTFQGGIILITGWIVDELPALPGIRVLQKPFALDELVSAVEDAGDAGRD